MEGKGKRMAVIGKPVNRQDGRLKVTGAATYSAEWSLPNMTYAVTVQSTVAKGTVESFDLAAAQTAPGVLFVMTHLNRPKLAPRKVWKVWECRWEKIPCLCKTT